uniref:Uncharacterized protein n=1 Tax=Panagrolaimus superbus TaxID=310955 RepID=A0A914Y1R6_9BILA
MAKRATKRGKSPDEALPVDGPSSSHAPTGTRRQDFLVPEDNLGIEQRPLILPTAREGADDFSSDDDDGFIDMERIDQAAQRQEIMVVDRVEKRRREAEVKEYMRCHLQRIRFKNDNIHKLHLFAVVSNFTKRMSTCVKLAKSLDTHIFPFPSSGQDMTSYLKSLCTKSWFKLKKFELFTTLSSEAAKDFYSVERMRLVAACVCETELDAAVATVVNLRSLGFTVRLVYAFKAVAKGETNVHITEEMMELFIKNGYSFPQNFNIKGRRTEAAEKKLKIGIYDKKRGKAKGKAAAQKIVESSESEAEMESASTSNEDDDFENEDDIETVKKKKPKIEKKKAAKPKKKALKPSAIKKIVEPMDTSEAAEKSFEKIKAKSYYFVEVWDDNEMMWIDFDPLKGTINDAESITKNLDKELDYVFAFDSDGGFRDVSIKYIKNFVLPERRQSRIEESYVHQLMQRKSIRAQLSRNLLEDELIYAKLLSMPLPRTKGGYKNHLFYALKEDLKVKEAIYPSDATPVDEHNIFDVFSRKNVGMLDIDLRWRRKGYQEGEEPYKLIAGRARGKKEAPQQKLFGPWQLERTPAPELDEDENIPVNSNGNVYLYKSWMTPKDCFHLKVNGHGEEIAKLADVENVQAIVAWTFKKAKYFPVMYGVVVKKIDLPAIMKAKKKFYAKRMNKKSEKRVRKTILPFVRKDKARQAFYKSFYRTEGSLANNDLEFLYFDFGIPNSSSFSSLEINTFVDGMPLTQYENGLSENVIENVDRYKKRQAEVERLAPKKVVAKPLVKSSPASSIAKADAEPKFSVKDESKTASVQKMDIDFSNRRVTRSSTRASTATEPASARKPLVQTQRNNIPNETESQSEVSESEEEFPRRTSIPASDTPSGKELKKKQAKRGRGRGGKKRL